jgi:hypothetical protein
MSRARTSPCERRDVRRTRGGPRSAMNASRVGCTLPASSVARLCKIAVRPSQFHGIRKRVNALLRMRGARWRRDG